MINRFIPARYLGDMIDYRSNLDGITADQCEGPFFAGWPNPPSPQRHLEILSGSDHVALAIHEPDGRVIGFATAITDGGFMAFIPLVEVVAGFQGRGIGSELVRRLLDELSDYYAVDALCDPELQPFYRHLGMKPATGVMWRNYSRQSGE